MSPFAFDVLLGMKLEMFGRPVVFCAPSTVWIILFSSLDLLDFFVMRIKDINSLLYYVDFFAIP